MQNILFFLRGPPFRNAMLMALEEICARDEVSRTRGWKLFLLLPRLLLHKTSSRWVHSQTQIGGKIRSIFPGQWATLLRESVEGAEMAATARSRRSRRSADDIAHRAERAQALVSIGEISSGRQALKGAALVPGTEDTLNALTDRDRRPVQPMRKLSRETMEFMREVPLNLDEKRFAQNLRSSRRGAAAGPSGMTTHHLRPLLSNPQEFHWLFRAAEQLARSQAPEVAVDAVRLGRMTALQKPDCGVRGIVAGDVLRRLVSRTIAQQIMKPLSIFNAQKSTSFRILCCVFEGSINILNPTKLGRKGLNGSPLTKATETMTESMESRLNSSGTSSQDSQRCSSAVKSQIY